MGEQCVQSRYLADITRVPYLKGSLDAGRCVVVDGLRSWTTIMVRAPSVPHVGIEWKAYGSSRAPLSEVYGRKQAVLVPYFVAAIFSFGTAAAKDVQTIMLTRFFAGFFGSAPVTNTGGVLSDIWAPEQRGTALVGYAMAVVGGPVLGPIAGGAIVQSYLGWRWTEYLTGIMMMFFLTLDVFFLDER